MPGAQWRSRSKCLAKAYEILRAVGGIGRMARPKSVDNHLKTGQAQPHNCAKLAEDASHRIANKGR